MNIKDYIKLFKKSFEEIKLQFNNDFQFIYKSDSEWLVNLEEKLYLLKNSDDKKIIGDVIEKIKNSTDFTIEDTTALSLFISKINNIVLIADRVNNFKDGKVLPNGDILNLYELFNEIKRTSLLKNLNLALNPNLKVFLPHLFSIVKHCQNPKQYPIYYKYWKNILREVLEKDDNYDSMCKFYREFPENNRHLNFAAYLGTIGYLIAKKTNEHDIKITFDSKEYQYLTKDVINIKRYKEILDKSISDKEEYILVNMKEEFKDYIFSTNREGSRKAESYIRAIELLDDIINSKAKDKLEGYESIYNIDSIKLISKLHLYILDEQKKGNGIFENEEPISYWRDRFYSAALKSYNNFLISRDKQHTVETNPFLYKSFHQKCKEAGLLFSEKMITRFVASLCTKPFVICSGLSGSGKTKLAQAFAQWICESDNQYKIIPVGADWTNREPLLGYPNAIETEKYVVPENGALELIINAIENPAKPYFLILDEMNLSHVERYFADFLSAMESGEPVFLHTIEHNDLTIPQKIKLPKNLFIIGTVNIDETTYMFSPKVLDRANTIEFRLNEADLENYFASIVDLDMIVLEKEGISMAANFVEIATDEAPKDFDTLKVDLLLFFTELKKTGAEFGYRTASEIGRLIQKLEGLGETGTDLLDIAIMQKLLPKLHGSRSKLSKVLLTLGALCLEDTTDFESKYFKKLDEIDFQDRNIKYKLSFEKIIRMYKNAMDNGFASYAEA